MVQKLIVTVNFISYPLENGRMIPEPNINQRYIGTYEDHRNGCEEFIKIFTKEAIGEGLNFDLVKTKG